MDRGGLRGGGLLVRNAVSDAPDVRIAVAPGLERLVVRVAGEVERIVDLAGATLAPIGIDAGTGRR